MSSDMARAILEMPLHLAMANEISRKQYHQRAQQMLSDHEALIAENQQLREAHDEARRSAGIAQQNADLLLSAAEALKADADRASYWKQRAKSAEGHLFASDWKEACRALHQKSGMASTPWDDLHVAYRTRIESAAASVIAVIAGRLNARRPTDSVTQPEEGKHERCKSA